MVARSYNNANANGGVAYVNANNDSSNTNTNNGSRLDNIKYQSAEVSQDEKDAVPAQGNVIAVSIPAACRASLHLLKQ